MLADVSFKDKRLSVAVNFQHSISRPLLLAARNVLFASPYGNPSPCEESRLVYTQGRTTYTRGRERDFDHPVKSVIIQQFAFPHRSKLVDPSRDLDCTSTTLLVLEGQGDIACVMRRYRGDSIQIESSHCCCCCCDSYLQIMR